MKLRLLFVFAFLAALMSGCQIEKSNTELLTGSNWRIQAWTITPPILGITDWFANLEPCETDNIFTFNTNGTAIIDEGALKCLANDPQTRTGTWSFNTDETTITLVSSGITQIWQLLDLTAKIFKIKYTDTDQTSGITNTHTITFEAI
ncbi:MAG TPA: hypothetical protein PK239_16250 [Chitinophagales bacterium]|nr:hypothetical protein [Chitinophagales bacterium]HRK28827.1 hypothetical protein [Chitinophagales bacterium]